MSKLTEQFPQFELRDAQLSNVQADSASDGMTLNFNHKKADLTQDFPRNLDQFKNVSSMLSEVLRATLEVKSYERAGVRYILTLPMKSVEEARDFFLKLGLISVKPEKLQPFLKGKIEEEQVVIRYEDDSRGYTFRLSHSPRDVALKVPRPFTISAEKFHKNAVFFDVDCYTKKPVESPIFVAADFVRLTFRTVEENLLPLLGL